MFIGRSTEMSELFLSLDRGKSITLLIGEGGIGKSSLLNEFHDQLWESRRDSHFVGYYERSKELRSAGLVYPFVIVLEDLLKWISATRTSQDEIKEAVSRIEKALIKFVKEKGTEMASALIQDIAEKIGLKETLKIAKDFLKTFKAERSATMLADSFVSENKREVISTYINIFNILKTEFEDYIFVLIFDQFENMGKASIDFLIDFIGNLPTKFHVVISFQFEENLWDDEVAKKVSEYARDALGRLGAQEIRLKGLSEEDIGKWIRITKGIELPLVPDLRRIRELTDGVPIILNEWINQSNNLDYEELDEFKKNSNTTKRLCK
jgi:predicted ATPase